jgi:hypothetical protein
MKMGNLHGRVMTLSMGWRNKMKNKKQKSLKKVTRDTRTNLIHVTFESSVLQGAAYSSYDRVLLLKFTNGTVYRYRKLPHLVASGLFLSKRPGVYFNRWIAHYYNGVRQ